MNYYILYSKKTLREEYIIKRTSATTYYDICGFSNYHDKLHFFVKKDEFNWANVTVQFNHKKMTRLNIMIYKIRYPELKGHI